jgi:hypothetical protein
MEPRAVERVWNLPELVDLILGQLDRWNDKYRAGCATEVARARLRFAFEIEGQRGNPFFGWTDFDQFAAAQAWLVMRQRQVRQPLVYLETLLLLDDSLGHWSLRGLYRRLDGILWIDASPGISHDMPLPLRVRPDILEATKTNKRLLRSSHRVHGFTSVTSQSSTLFLSNEI